MIIAIKMIFPSRNASLQEEFEDEPFIVPLAIPYVAGQSPMATSLLMMSRETASPSSSEKVLMRFRNDNFLK